MTEQIQKFYRIHFETSKSTLDSRKSLINVFKRKPSLRAPDANSSFRSPVHGTPYRIKLTAKTVDEDPAGCNWISRKEIKSAKILKKQEREVRRLQQS